VLLVGAAGHADGGGALDPDADPDPGADLDPAARARADAAARTVAEGAAVNAWQSRLRRPERFALLHDAVTVTGTVRQLKREADADYHIQCELDPEFAYLLNQRNHDAQRGCLVLEIEPWQTGSRSQAPGAEAVNDRPPEVWAPLVSQIKPGTRLQIEGAVVVDGEGGHGWVEIHAPTALAVLPGSVVVPTAQNRRRPSERPVQAI
jgi:hypothetical protein